MGSIFGRNTDNIVDPNMVENPPEHLQKRIEEEVRILKENADVQSYFRFESAGQDEKLNRFCIYGYLLPGKEPYIHGEFKVRITLPAYFPYKPPELQLLTPIYHPAVHEDVSQPEFCCNHCSIDNFGSTDHICQVIKYYVDIIDRPNLFYKNCRYNFEASILYHDDEDRYNEKALEWVTKHARPRQN